MSKQDAIDLYVMSIDLAKEREGMSNKDKLLLNRFKILLRSEAVENVDTEIAQMGKVSKKTIHSIRELADSIFEDWMRNMIISDDDRERDLREGKQRADFAEAFLINELSFQGMIIDN